MSAVQIGGQDFVLLGSNPLTIAGSSHNDFFPNVQVPREFWSGQLVPLQTAERRGNALQATRVMPAPRTLTLINLDDSAIRSSAYKYLNLLLMGPFRPEPRPTTGFTYPRRTRI